MFLVTLENPRIDFKRKIIYMGRYYYYHCLNRRRINYKYKVIEVNNMYNENHLLQHRFYKVFDNQQVNTSISKSSHEIQTLSSPNFSQYFS